jgi:hypothetical protein
MTVLTSASLRRIGRRAPALLAALALLALGSSAARATWYSENVEDGADIIMMDLRWPWWPSGTYYANWNSGFNPKPNNISFYGGFVATAPDGPGQAPNADEAIQTSFRPGSVWTFWGADKAGTPVRFIDVAPNLYIRNDYGGEGSSGTVGGVAWPFVTCRRWYTMLGRVWQAPGKGGEPCAYVGRWIKDHANGRWHLIGVARLPIPATSFTGNSGFIESLSGEKVVRSLHRRLGYYRKEGSWRKSDAISIDKTEYVVVNTAPEDDHEYAAIEYSNRPDLLPQRLDGKPISGDRKHTFTVRQPELPTLDRPAVSHVRAVTTGSQVAVSWEIPDGSSPAFGYRIEVFDNPACRGARLAVREGRMPAVRQALVDVMAARPTIRLTVTDVFDQSARPVVVTASAAPHPAAPSAKRDPTIAGLEYELYRKETQRKGNVFSPPLQAPDERHFWLSLAEMPQGRLVRRGISRGFDIGVKDQVASGYALRFRGLLRVPVDGFYLFRAQIDGAYRLRIGGVDLLAWDGQHGTSERTAVRRLTRGDHTIEVAHLYDELPAANFGISWEGPGLARRPIPLEALRLPDHGAYPKPRLAARAPGDGTGQVSVTVDARGHRVERSTLFLGRLQLAEAAGPSVRYDGPLPRGANSLWARIVYDGNRSMDSAPITLTVTGKPVGADWTVRNVSDAKARAGLWQAAPGSFVFFGSGMHTVTRKVTGDFTATCRIDAYNGAHGEPVNPQAWVGLTAREYGERLNWEWGQDFHLVQTARNGLRTSAEFTDFGATRISSYELPANRPWLRIVRRGHIWTAWTSQDGRKWEIGGYQYKRARAEMDVGLFISALPQDARANYHARVSHLVVEPGASADPSPPTPPVARSTGGNRITGVAMARSDPRVVVVRTTAAGLLRTTDRGATWAPANASLTGADLAVRSVAIHPQEPMIMLRAGAGGLWKTLDGGQNWQRLSLDADFDGTGPSALCGEVVAFDLREPRAIYAGSESRGFFRSSDGGSTWTGMGLAGERITAVTVWPWELQYPGTARGRTHICVTTCPDRWMAFLGRGAPTTATGAIVSRGYASSDGVRTLSVSDEREDTGFYSVAFDKAMQSTNEMRYGTTHGFQAQIFTGSHMALYPPQKCLDWFRPMTAVAATAMGDQKFGRFMAQALDPETPGRYSRSQVWAFEWSWLQPKGDVPTGGAIAACGDVTLGEEWWFVHTDGLYHSPDGGITLRKVLDQWGRPVAPAR